MIRPGALIRESAATAISQPVSSVLTVLMVAGMILAVMLTTGRTVAAEQEVLASIDSAGTRAITIRAEEGAGLTSSVLARIAFIDGIEWSGAFSMAVDGSNPLIAGGTRVPTRLVYGDSLGQIGVPVSNEKGELAYASELALTQLGLVDIAGSVTLTNGANYAVVGRLEVPDYLEPFEPLVLVPQLHRTGAETVSVLVVIAERPGLVGPVSEAVLSVLGLDDSTKVSVQTSESLAKLRALIEGQLGSFSRGLVLVLLAVTGALVALLLYGLVLMRRKDYGRRRALGATRGLIVALLLTQTGLLAALGVCLGAALATAILLLSASPLAGPAFTLSLAILAICTAIVSALIPALLASRREPIRELRVP